MNGKYPSTSLGLGEASAYLPERSSRIDCTMALASMSTL